MSLASCNVLISQQSGRSFTISRSLSKALQLGATKTITVRLGSKSVSLPLYINSQNGNTIVVSSATASQLRLPKSGKCMVRSSKGELQLGPLIGILTSIETGGSSPFGGRTGFIREIMRVGENRGFFVAFSPQQVDWTDETVTGYIPSDTGVWIRKTVPLPDVIYNRLPSRKAEKSTSIHSFKDRFVRRRIPFFNWSFFDKWDVYRLLEGESEAYKYVPESINSPTAEDIRVMMEKHKFVYLKPTAGSLGIGIYRLTYNSARGYFARFRRNGQNVLIRFPRFEGLHRMLQRHNVRFANYVVQQGVRLIELEGCPIDFRFHMTKNGNNEWVPAGIGAKKAGKGSVTTHVRTGGQLMTPEYVLNRVFGSKSEHVLQNAKDAAVKLATAIENNYNHLLGELGFDIGIDQDERIWMFEANAKPGRSIFKHPALKEQGRASLANLVEHCLYLSRFRARREGQ